MRPWLLAVAVALTTAPVLAADIPDPVHPIGYSLEADISPATGEVQVTGAILVTRPDLDHPRLTFVLHETFEISSLRVNEIDSSFEYQELSSGPTRPASRRVLVDLPEQVREAFLGIEIRYGGILSALPQYGSEAAVEGGRALDDAVTEQRVELAYYSAWYPQFGDFGASFSSRLDLTLPRGWRAVAPGRRTALTMTEGGITTRWEASRTSDLVVVAAPDLEIVAADSGGVSVEIAYTRLPATFIQRETDTVRASLQLYTELLGEPFQPGAPVRIVYSPRARGQGGYTRTGMIVMSEGRVLVALVRDPRLSLLHGTAHEAAHFWWSFGTGQGDWINEAFAEYFALVAVERIDSAEHARRLLERYRQSVGALPDDAPSLAAVPASNRGHGYAIRYHKGSLMLHEIRTTLGDRPFLAACRDFYA